MNKTVWCKDIAWFESTSGSAGWRIYGTQLIQDGWKLCPICGKERPREPTCEHITLIELTNGWCFCPTCGKQRPKEPKKMAERLYEIWRGGDDHFRPWDRASEDTRKNFTSQSQAALEAVFEVIDGINLYWINGHVERDRLKQAIREKLG